MARILKFIVNGQNISKDSSCDFSKIARGTKGYLVAEFVFSPDWDGYVKAGVFRASCGTEVASPIINDRCEIPSTALTQEAFIVSVVGMAKDGSKIKSEKVEVMQS